MDHRQFRFGLLNDASDNDKLDFIKKRIVVYRQKAEWTDGTLFECFAGDFWHFAAKDFKTINTYSRRTLWDLLRSRGVCVAKGRNTSIGDSFFAVVQNDIPWPEGKHREQLTSLTGSTESAEVDGDAGTVFQCKIQENLEAADGWSFTTARTANKKENFPYPFNAYTNDDDQYSGIRTDNFEKNFVHSKNRCDKVDVFDIKKKTRALSIMLNENARQYYLVSFHPKNLHLPKLVQTMKNRFHRRERTRALLRDSELLLLNNIISKNSKWSLSECLELILEKLCDSQASLPKEYRNDSILTDKLLKPQDADTVQGVISDLHISLSRAGPSQVAPRDDGQ